MAAAPAAPAAQDLVGVWQGKLALDPKTSLTIQFTFAKDAQGAYTAVLNSPDNGAIKNTPATGVTWDGSNVKLKDLQETDKALINYEPDAYTPAIAIKVVGKGEVKKVGGDD